MTNAERRKQNFWRHNNRITEGTEHRCMRQNRKKERVILVGISLSDAEDVDQSLDELEELARTAGAECVGRVIQKRELSIEPYGGKGQA